MADRDSFYPSSLFLSLDVCAQLISPVIPSVQLFAFFSFTVLIGLLSPPRAVFVHGLLSCFLWEEEGSLNLPSCWFHYVVYLFIYLTVAFEEQMLLILLSFYQFILWIVFYLLFKFFLFHVGGSLFSTRSFIVLGLSFRNLIYF